MAILRGGNVPQCGDLHAAQRAALTQPRAQPWIVDPPQNNQSPNGARRPYFPQAYGLGFPRLALWAKLRRLKMHRTAARAW